MSNYLHAVHRNVQEARRQGTRDRQLAVRAARQRVARFGADAAPDAALAIPPPSPIGSALSQDVVSAATSAFQSTGPTTAVQEGISAVDAATVPSGPPQTTSPQALDAARAAQSPSGLAGFDAGIAMAHGAARSGGRVPRAMRPAERAGWLAAFGLEGADADTKKSVMGSAVQAASSGSPAAQGFVRGAASAVGAMSAGQSPVVAAGSYTPRDAWTGAVVYGAVPIAAAGAITGLFKMGTAYFLTVAGISIPLGLAIGWLVGNRYATALVNAGKQAVSPTPAALAAGAPAPGSGASTPAGGGPAVPSTAATAPASA